MTASSQTIANAPWMRLVALVLAILLAIGAWFVWQEAERRSDRVTALPSASQLPALGTPASVDDCVAQRSDRDQCAAQPGPDGRGRRPAVAAAGTLALHPARLVVAEKVLDRQALAAGFQIVVGGAHARPLRDGEGVGAVA